MKCCRSPRIALIAISLVLGACAKTADTPTEPVPPPIPFQGPLNASFESNTWWTFVSTNSLDCVRNGAGNSMAGILTGTGFMPTSGIQYARFVVCNLFTAPTASAYQDLVDLTHSRTLTFDYSFSGAVGSGGGTATAQILFTSNGTATLWTKVIDGSTTLPAQKLGESVTLPATTAPGRLTITFTVAGGHTGPTNSLITQTIMTFGIDNLIVK